MGSPAQRVAARTAAGVLAVLTVVAAALSLLLLDPRYLLFAAGAAGLAVVARTIGRRTLVIVVLSCLAGLLGLLALAVAAVLVVGVGAPSPPHRQARVSIRYTGHVVATGTAVTLTETVFWDQQFEKNVRAAFPGRKVERSAITLPAGWQLSGALDDSLVYVRKTGLPEFGSGFFGVSQATVGLDLGDARLGAERFAIVPATGSPLAITTGKGTLGNSDPAADRILDLPGRPALQSLTVKTTPLRESVTVDVLGAALRNPAGRMLYDAGSWGYLPWLLSALVLACAAFAADLVKDRIRTALSRGPRPESDPPANQPPQRSAPPGLTPQPSALPDPTPQPSTPPDPAPQPSTPPDPTPQPSAQPDPVPRRAAPKRPRGRKRPR
jgi:hypothetical protein